MGERFFSITTEVMRAHLRQAYYACQKRSEFNDPNFSDGTALIKEIIERQKCAMEAIETGAPIRSSAANGHMAAVQDPGTGSAAPQEFVEMWENLLSRKGSPVGIGVEPAKRLLNFAAQYGLDADDPECWPDPLPDPVQNPPKVTDEDIYEFVMCNLIPITEYQSDYIWLRIPPGLNYV